MIEGVKNLLGLARKAGKIASGDLAVREAVSKGKAALVLLAGDAGPSTVDRFTRLCGQRSIDCIRIGSQEELGRALGQSPRAVLAVTDVNFARGVRDALVKSVVNGESANIRGCINGKKKGI